MDTQFQTSFIPKKPAVTIGSGLQMHAHKGGSSPFFGIFAIIVFVISVVGAAFAFIWNIHENQVQTAYQKTLAANESQFDPSVIQNLARFSTKITYAENLLSTHLSPDEVFNIIAQLTAENVAFSTFSYTAPSAADSSAKISMTGIGTSFSALAFQSDVFGSSAQYGEQVAFINPVLSNLTLNQNGSVGFSFNADLSPTNILYSKILAQSLGETTPSQSGSQSSQPGQTVQPGQTSTNGSLPPIPTPPPTQ